MNTYDLQQIKMAWLAAEEAGDTQTKLALLRDYPDLQDTLIDFVAASHVTSQAGMEPELLPMTQRAMQKALNRVFTPAPEVLTAKSLRELRTQRKLTLVTAAKGLRLSVDVWKKFEDGLIELSSLGEKQLQRLAAFFEVSSSQFNTLLGQSQPAFNLNRRQTAEAAKQGTLSATRQSFTEALERSTMSATDKAFWLD